MNGQLKTAAKIGLTLGLMVACVFGVSLALTDPTIGRDRTSRPRSVQRSGNVKQGQEAWNTREDGSPCSMAMAGSMTAAISSQCASIVP